MAITTKDLPVEMDDRACDLARPIQAMITELYRKGRNRTGRHDDHERALALVKFLALDAAESESIPGVASHSELARLRSIVEQSGLTQSQVAERAEMSQGDLARALSGKRANVSLALVRRILVACDARWADLD